MHGKQEWPEPSTRMTRAREELPMALSANRTHGTAHTLTHAIFALEICGTRPLRLGGMLVSGLGTSDRYNVCSVDGEIDVMTLS